MIRRFELVRYTDTTGVSGVGVVASGVQWPDGRVSVRWRVSSGVPGSTCSWDCVNDVIKVHGHDGATELRWLDGDGVPS